MDSLARVRIHSSQFPDAVANQLALCLRHRKLNHKFLYQSHKQTQRWLALHSAFSPSRTDADCAAIYDQAFRVCAHILPAESIHLVGLGCGAGQKDSRLLELLAPRRLFYTPVDVSVDLVVLAREKALSWSGDEGCRPLVCDLAATNIGEVLDLDTPQAGARLLTFFGMTPNFEPSETLSVLDGLLRPGDYLLLSANLAPGEDYSEGVLRVFPLYDNQLTRAWLLTFLFELGCEAGDGDLAFGIETGPAPESFQRIVANFTFRERREFLLGAERIAFSRGDNLRLFFSYRHTPNRLRDWLASRGLSFLGEWLAKSGEEGVFLFRADR